MVDDTMNPVAKCEECNVIQGQLKEAIRAIDLLHTHIAESEKNKEFWHSEYARVNTQRVTILKNRDKRETDLVKLLKEFGPFHLRHTDLCTIKASHPDPIENCICRVKRVRAILKE